MNTNHTVLLWILALIITAAAAYYQRITGPTYPVSGKIYADGQQISYKFPRSSDTGKPAEIIIESSDSNIGASLRYRKYRSAENWQTERFSRINGRLTAELPTQPPAGKLEYEVSVRSGENEIYISEEPIVIRFKGSVPLTVLVPHILLMFSAMLFSTRTGLEALRKGAHTQRLTLITLTLLGIGGLILGPVVQKFAFGEFWTGWPFGEDLTDNKTLIAFLAWLIALLIIRKKPSAHYWAVAASLILLVVYLIPHSMFGSELDYSSGQIRTGE